MYGVEEKEYDRESGEAKARNWRTPSCHYKTISDKEKKRRRRRSEQMYDQLYKFNKLLHFVLIKIQ